MTVKDSDSISPERRSGHLISDLPVSDQMAHLFQKHKLRLLKAKYHYSSLNYSKFVSKEILRHDRDEQINENIFFKNKSLTKESLSQILKIKLKHPIESYLVIKNPLTVDDIFLDIESLGNSFFKDSQVDFSRIKDRVKIFLSPLKLEKGVLNQLTLLKIENPKKYTDMIRTGMLNYVIESRFTEDKKTLENSLLAGIFHDIGFLYLDPKVHERKAKADFSITDMKKIQSHAELGFHLLKTNFHEDIANAALNHHLGEDSSGYPRQMVIAPNRLSRLTGFSSAFVTCLGKHALKNALKIQDIYSREKSYFGEALKPFFSREFYRILADLDLQFNKDGKNSDVEFNRRYSVILHNFLVYIFDLGSDLEKIDTLLLNYIKDKAAHRLELQNDIDDVFDYIKKLNMIIKSCGKSPGIRQIMKNNFLASRILGDIEIISMEVHRSNQSLFAFFRYLKNKVDDHAFETTVFKKVREFSNNIKRNISSQVEKELNIFDLLNAVSD